MTTLAKFERWLAMNTNGTLRLYKHQPTTKESSNGYRYWYDSFFEDIVLATSWEQAIRMLGPVQPHRLLEKPAKVTVTINENGEAVLPAPDIEVWGIRYEDLQKDDWRICPRFFLSREEAEAYTKNVRSQMVMFRVEVFRVYPFGEEVQQ